MDSTGYHKLPPTEGGKTYGSIAQAVGSTNTDVFSDQSVSNPTTQSSLGVQIRALLQKEILNLKRNKLSTFLQIFAPFLFIFFLWIMAFGVQSRYSVLTEPVHNFDPKTPYHLPHCGDFTFHGEKCFSLACIVSSPNEKELCRQLQKYHSFEDDEVAHFSSQNEADVYQLKNPNSTQAVVMFNVTNVGTEASPKQHIGYQIQYNMTNYYRRSAVIDQIEVVYIPLLHSIEQVIHQKKGQADMVVSYSDFPHPEFMAFEVFQNSGPTMILGSLMFGVVIQLASLVREKEFKLREAMSMAGMTDAAYWISTLCTNVAINFCSTTVLIISGFIFQFDFFLKNNFFTYTILFFLFGISMVFVVLVLYAFMSKEKTASSLGFILFLAGSMIQGMAQVIFEKSFFPLLRLAFSFFPPVLLAYGVYIIGEYTNDPGDTGMKWSDVGNTEWFSLVDVYVWLVIDIVVYLVGGIYLDNVIQSEYGTAKPLLYFLRASYWKGEPMDKVSGHEKNRAAMLVAESIANLDEDVVQERRAVENQTEPYALEVRNLVKSYTNTKISLCSPFSGFVRRKCFDAVKGTMFGVKAKTLLAFLGHNGSGKTTTINMLTGLFSATSGSAKIYGYDISTQMPQIRRFMGVCPQHDILFAQLTAREHLQLFAELKGIRPESVAAEVEKRLEDVHLTAVGNVIAGAFSGGMKRRLSVAIALIGDPKIVFLDEPTTGMDPVSRRQVWELIEKVKAGRLIFLTTHSMEEAEVLGDKIVIMARGQITAVGTTLHLKNKFGAGYHLDVLVKPPTETATPQELARVMQRASEYIGAKLGGISPFATTADQLSFAVPHDAVNLLPALFDELKAGLDKTLGITDISISLTTLEEVFLKISEEDERKYAELMKAIADEN